MSKVSIVIPTYDRAEMLPAAIESALGQTYPDMEVVVVNDGSPDDTDRAVDPYLDEPNFLYVKQENRGLAAARNRGISESHGQYLNFLDDDDRLHPEMVARTACLLDRDESLAFVYCDTIRVAPDGTESTHYSVGEVRGTLNGDIFPTLLKHGYFPVHGVLVRRSAVEEVAGFDESLEACEDYDLWLRIAAGGGLACYLPERLVYYRRRPGTMSADRGRMRESRQAIFAKLFRRYPDRCAEALAEVQADYERAWSAVREADERARCVRRDPVVRAYLALKRRLGGGG
ncbi:MAG: glycosyltransferase [Candidatus Brocadiia bacterium]